MTSLSQRMKRRAGAVVAAIGLTAALAACGGGQNSAGGGGGGNGGGGTTTVRIALPTSVTSFANADIVVADQLGYFKDAGLSVKVSNLKSGSSVATGVVGKQFEVGGASIEPVINAFAGGGNIKVIGGYTDRLEVEMVTPAEIKSPADLRGQPLGIQEVGAFREVMTRMVLESAGMTPKDVQYVSVNANAYTSALIQGQIKSAILHPEQAIQAQEKDASLHSIVNLYDVEPNYFYGVYFVSGDWLKNNPKAAQGFTEAITRAHREMYNDKDKVVPIIAKATQFDEKTIAAAYDVYMKQVQAFPVNEGLEQNRLEYTVKRMEEMGTLSQGANPDLNAFIDRGPITAAVEKLGRQPERAAAPAGGSSAPAGGSSAPAAGGTAPSPN
ncbi:ABC transporter substrate-binding protein, partial [Georgenia thermotolerans]